jgi:hypothetical protein
MSAVHQPRAAGPGSFAAGPSAAGPGSLRLILAAAMLAVAGIALVQVETADARTARFGMSAAAPAERSRVVFAPPSGVLAMIPETSAALARR